MDPGILPYNLLLEIEKNSADSRDWPMIAGKAE
jgi:hypothetical protein